MDAAGEYLELLGRNWARAPGVLDFSCDPARISKSEICKKTVMSSRVISRSASLLVVALYLCLAAFGELPKRMESMLGIAFMVGLPLIWFPEPIGSMIIPSRDRPAPTETPPVLIALMGWALLLGVPIVVAFLSRDATPATPVHRPFPR
jgi:hypothetical protein